MNLGQDRHMQMVGVQNPSVQNVGLNANQIGNGNVVAARAKGDLDEIKEVNANCILMVNLQQASTSGTQIDKSIVYDSDRSAEHYPAAVSSRINFYLAALSSSPTALNT
nr:hypothetical protein [Tanacetum cinerariifolium]